MCKQVCLTYYRMTLLRGIVLCCVSHNSCFKKKSSIFLLRIKVRALPAHSQCPVPITKMNWSERKGLSQQGRGRGSDGRNGKNGEKSLSTIHGAQFQRVRGAKKKELSYIMVQLSWGLRIWSSGRISPSSCCQIEFVAMRDRPRRTMQQPARQQRARTSRDDRESRRLRPAGLPRHPVRGGPSPPALRAGLK